MPCYRRGERQKGGSGMSDSELDRLRSQIQWLRDLEEIKQLKARYCRLVDSQEWKTWGDEILTEDFYFESDGGVQEGRDAVVAFVSKALQGASTVHHCHTPEITITGADEATGIWAMQDHVKLPRDDHPIMFRGAGHYYEDYVRTPNGWRIRRAVLKRLSVDMIQQA